MRFWIPHPLLEVYLLGVNLSTLKAGAGGWRVLGQSELHRENLPKINKNKKA